VVRQLEGRHRCRLAVDVLPTVLELTRRYQRDAAFPGKAARLLGQLAVKYQDREVTRDATLEEFRAKSGLQTAFLDRRAKLPRQHVADALRRRIIGQQPAVDALADVVAIAKARLNDPGRPLGSVFFAGPTGVGKTESAKALAAYLFGDPSRLLRFDMNEYVSAASAARLVGTFHQPEGLLTGAVRRQPFSVILLDEIEKAHPDVFDLLLQILGEARLSDALGRTVDFGSAVVILTSNLGTREAASEIGFGREGAAADRVYLRAVEQFFRPELFNRLDRIVPFARLGRDELGQIAHRIVADVVAREGLVRRRCAVEIDPGALEWVIDRGTEPVLGARAMRRAVEREMVRPMAGQLAAIAPDAPTVLSVSRQGDRLSVQATALDNAACRASAARPDDSADPQELLQQAAAALERIESECMRLRPAGEVTSARSTTGTWARWSSCATRERCTRAWQGSSGVRRASCTARPRRRAGPGRASSGSRSATGTSPRPATCSPRWPPPRTSASASAS